MPCSAGASTLVQIVSPSSIKADNLTVIAEPLAVLDGRAAAQRIDARQGVARADLGPGYWRVGAVAPGGWWVWPQDVTIEPGAVADTHVTLTLSPAGTMRGTFRVAQGLVSGVTEYAYQLAARAGLARAGLAEVKAYLRRGSDARSWAVTSADAVVTCRVTDWSGFTCEVPSGVPLDVEMNTPGYAPYFVWDAVVPVGRVLDLGTLPLSRGASVSGWVVGADGKPAASASVQLLGLDALVPIAGAPKPVAATKRGFFQILQAPEGKFHVSASADGALSNADVVEVVPAKEIRLRNPLRLVPPVELRLSLDPAAAPDGDPWLVRLLTWAGAHGHVWANKEPVSKSGTWRKTGLPAGDYNLSIERADGSTWLSDRFTLEQGVETRELMIQFTRVTGKVTVGGSPALGRVKIAESRTKGRVAFTTDDEGGFSGIFPRVNPQDASWILSFTFAEPPGNVELADVEPVASTESLIEFAIALPSTSIEGTVVDEAGVPHWAMVTVVPSLAAPSRSMGSSRMIQAAADGKTGRFSVAGLEPGNYEVYAGGESEPGSGELIESPGTTVRVDRKGSTSVRLVMAKRLRLSGKVLTSAGVPLPGTRLVIRSAESNRGFETLHSNAEGVYSVHLPSDTRTVLIDASAPGVGRRFFRRPVPRDGVLDIELDLNGGRIVLDNVESGAATVLLFHDGGYANGPDLFTWSQVNGEASAEDTVPIPLLDPGEYAVCRPTHPNQTPVSLPQRGFPSTNCAQGTLLPGGELRLNVPGQMWPGADSRAARSQ